MSKKKKTIEKQDYTKIKYAAYEYVVAQGKTQREAAAILGVSEQSLSQWAKEGKWRYLRKARQSTDSTTIENTKQIVALLSIKRLDIEEEINNAVEIGDADEEIRLRKEASRISDEMSKCNATLKNTDKKGAITLGVCIDVMDDIFNSLREYDEETFEKTIDFQGIYLRKKINQLG